MCKGCDLPFGGANRFMYIRCFKVEDADFLNGKARMLGCNSVKYRAGDRDFAIPRHGHHPEKTNIWDVDAVKLSEL